MVSIWNINKKQLRTKLELDETGYQLKINPMTEIDFSISSNKNLSIWNFNYNDKQLSLVEEVVNVSSTQNDFLANDVKIVDHCWIPKSLFMIVVYNNNNIELYRDNSLVQRSSIKLTNNDISDNNQVDKDKKEGLKPIDAVQRKFIVSNIFNLTPKK